MRDMTNVFPLPEKSVSGPTIPPDMAGLGISKDELDSARLTPKCFVDKHTYADVGLLLAPGGTGKTTLLLYESIHIALGLPLYGLRVMHPGWTLFVSAEDQRERLVARLREIGLAMCLDETQWAAVLRSVGIWDVCGQGTKLVYLVDGNLEMSPLVDRIIATYEDNPPAVIVFDPLISFGASEQMVNDNEQALITAGRRLVSGLECCVKYIHHTGKANIGANGLHMYSGRGGSALSDGARTIMALQPWSKDVQGMPKPPEGCHADSMGTGTSLTILARPKMSYAEPNLPHIWLQRAGFGFVAFSSLDEDEARSSLAREQQVLTFLSQQILENHYYSTRQLNVIFRRFDMTQAQLRVAVAELEATNRLTTAVVPSRFNGSGKRQFLCPSNLAGDYK